MQQVCPLKLQMFLEEWGRNIRESARQEMKKTAKRVIKTFIPIFVLSVILIFIFRDYPEESLLGGISKLSVIIGVVSGNLIFSFYLKLRDLKSEK